MSIQSEMVEACKGQVDREQMAAALERMPSNRHVVAVTDWLRAGGPPEQLEAEDREVCVLLQAMLTPPDPAIELA